MDERIRNIPNQHPILNRRRLLGFAGATAAIVVLESACSNNTGEENNIPQHPTRPATEAIPAILPPTDIPMTTEEPILEKNEGLPFICPQGPIRSGDPAPPTAQPDCD